MSRLVVLWCSRVLSYLVVTRDNSTMFLFGPCAQLKNMFKATRWIATVIYLVAMGVTLYCAFGVRHI